LMLIDTLFNGQQNINAAPALTWLKYSM